MDDDDPLLTSTKAGAMLGVDGTTVTRWAIGQKIDSIELPSGHRRFRLSVVLGILAGTPAGGPPDGDSA